MTSPVPASTADDGLGELERAADDLEALADAHDECVGALEDAEGIADVVLDDPGLRVAVVDGGLRIRALSRGMADLLGVGPEAVGAALPAPPGWPRLRDLLPEAEADGWRTVTIDGAPGTLAVRRATSADHDPAYVVRADLPDAPET
jgi:hypothetical protein